MDRRDKQFFKGSNGYSLVLKQSQPGMQCPEPDCCLSGSFFVLFGEASCPHSVVGSTLPSVWGESVEGGGGATGESV